MNTRSVKSSHVSAFGNGSAEADGTRIGAIEGDPPRPDRADLQPARRHAGPAIEHEGDRAGAPIGALQLIRDERHVGLRHVGVVAEPNSPPLSR